MVTKVERLITHSGSFHADDVLAYIVLRKLFPYAELIRTREAAVLENLSSTDIVFDVGGIFDPELQRFDHHQKGRPCREDGTPYSSLGLIWKYFGHQYLDLCLPNDSASLRSEVWDCIDKRLVLEVDRCDNGVTGFADVQHRTDANLSQMVEDFCPRWDDQSPDYDFSFLEAASYFHYVFNNRVLNLASGMRAREHVIDALRNRKHLNIAIIPPGLPVGSIVHDPEFEDVLYLVSKPLSGTDWYVNCVSLENDQFSQRKPLPAEWAGLRNEDLASVTGIHDAVFCHLARFICAAKSFESAVMMAEIAVAYDPSSDATISQSL